MVNPIRTVFHWADSDSKKIAITGAGAEINFALFRSSVVKVAALMRKQGVKPGSVVGLRMHGGLYAVFAAAVMHEGAVAFAAKATIVTKYRDDIDFVFSDEQELVGLAKNGILVNTDFLLEAERINTDIQPNEFDSEDSLAHLVFSSGTTGIPKGVQFTVKDLEQRTAAAKVNWMPQDPFFCQLAIDTVSGAISLFHSLFNGETFFISGSTENDLELIEKHGIASIQTSPAKLKDLYEKANQQQSQLRSIREYQVAGGLLSERLGAEIASMSGVTLTYIYGSTEVGLVAKGQFSPSDPQLVGIVVSSAEVQIFDESGAVLEFNKEGTLRIRTSYQSRTYWKLDNSASSAFSDGWFYPGDTAKLSSDGKLWILGRIDEIVNLSGMKVDPAWIDARIAGYRGIKDYACFAIPDENLLFEKLAIAIVFDEDIQIDSFMQFLKSELGDNSPQLVVRVLEIPRNSMGKPSRIQLRDDYLRATGNS